MSRRALATVIGVPLVVAVAVVVVIVLMARDDDGDGRTASLLASIDASESEGTAGIGFYVRIEDLPPDLGEISVSGEGVVAFADGSTDLTVRLSEGMATFAGGTAGDLRLVDDGDEAWLLPPGEERWRPVARNARRTDSGSFDHLVGTDPTAGLAFVRAAATAVDVDGSNDVRGREATRYEVRLEPGRVGEGDAGAPIADLLDALGFDTVYAYVWVDEEGRVVRVRYDADLARLTGGGPFGAGGRFITEFEYFDFGTAVTPEPPPMEARSVDAVDAAELEQLLGGLGL